MNPAGGVLLGDRRREFRRLLAVSALGHALLVALLALGSPHRSATRLPAVVRVDLVAAVPRARPARHPQLPPRARPAPPPAPRPAPKPARKAKRVVLPERPTAEPTPTPAPPPEAKYEDVLAELRAAAGEPEPEPQAEPAQPPGPPAPAAEGAGGVSPEVRAWVRRAKAQVTGAWILPPGFLAQSLEAELEVRLSASGDVRDARVIRRSGNPWYDESVVRAIEKASPLPPPPEAGDWRFVFHPGDAP